MDYITDLRATDVLLGRGSGPNDHEGNIRFRQMVAERKPEYMATNHRLTKAKIAQEIVDSVFANNGRFLRKLENDELLRFGVPDGVDAWVLATEDTIMEKAKQALRQNTSKAKADETGKPKLSPKNSPKQAPRRLSPMPPTMRASVPAIPVGLDDCDLEPLPLTRGYTLDPAQLSIPAPTLTGSSNHDRRSVSPKPVRIMPDQVVPSSSVAPLHQHHQHASQLPARHSPVPPPPQQHSPIPPHRHSPVPPQQHSPLPPQRQQQQPFSWEGRQAAGIHAPVLHNVNNSNNNHLSPVHLSRQDLDLQDDSILSHLPSHLRAQFFQQAPPVCYSSTNDTNQQSFDHIPNPDEEQFHGVGVGVGDPYPAARSGGGIGGGGGGNRHGSITMNELARFHQTRKDRYQANQASSDNMSVVMDSFSKMKTSDVYGGGSSSYRNSESGGIEHRKMYASTETMDTIEPIGVGSMADMSFATMNSSTFSVFRGNDAFASSSLGLGVGPDPDSKTPPSPISSGRVIVEPAPQLGDDYPYALVDRAAQAPAGGSGIGGEPASHGRYNAPFSHADLVQRAARYQNSNSLHNPNNINHSAILEGNEYVAGGEQQDGLVGPRPIRLMEDQPDEFNVDTMGLSSMSVLKTAFLSSTDDWTDILPRDNNNNNVQHSQQQAHQQPTSNYRHDGHRG